MSAAATAAPPPAPPTPWPQHAAPPGGGHGKHVGGVGVARGHVHARDGLHVGVGQACQRGAISWSAGSAHSHGDQEIFSVDEMVRAFDICQVNRAASAFDLDKLALDDT